MKNIINLNESITSRFSENHIGSCLSQNIKVDNLLSIIEDKEKEIRLLRKEIIKEILLNGYVLVIKPKHDRTEGVKLKSNPSYNSLIIDTIREGEKVIVFEKSVLYYKVKYHSMIGYISSSVLDIGDAPIRHLPYTINQSTTSESKNNSGSKSAYKTSSYRSTSGCRTVRCSGATKKSARCQRRTKNCSGRCFSH